MFNLLLQIFEIHLEKKIFDYIRNTELFLISLIPFMRGYSTIVNNQIIKEKLTQLNAWI